MKRGPSLRTRKPITRLTAGDFKAFPIWEYAIDEEGIKGRNETWVRPVDASVVSRGKWSQLVAATFTAASGKRLNGFMDVSTGDGKVEIEPGAILGRVGYKALPEFLRANCKKATMAFRLAALIRGEQKLRTGRIT